VDEGADRTYGHLRQIGTRESLHAPLSFVAEAASDVECGAFGSRVGSGFVRPYPGFLRHTSNQAWPSLAMAVTTQA
jgi:hypothetical protein